MIQTKSKILFNQEVAPSCWKMQLLAPEIAKQAQPGQFVHLRCTENYSPLLRRPFSLHRTSERKIEILYQIIGQGTRLLAEKVQGETVDLLGPLGRAFQVKDQPEIIVLVAGGVGIAPLYFLAETLLKKPSLNSKLILFYGVKSKENLLGYGDLKKLRINLEIATEDGSLGFEGEILQLFQSRLLSLPSQSLQVFACGPLGMLKNIASLSLKYNFPAQVSLEKTMGCGIGVCRGCVIKGSQGYLRVCKEGPVFPVEDIDWAAIS